MDPKKLSIGILGVGYWGKNIVRNLNELGVAKAIADTYPENLSAISEQYPDLVAFLDPHELIENPNIQAVAIATPAATHGELVRKSLLAGKHVFVEKPLCLDVEEAVELQQLSRDVDRTLMVGHLLLYHPGFRAVQKAVADGEIGNLRYIYSNRLSLGKIRREENALWSFAPHDISMILALTKQLPSQVISNGGNYLSRQIADTTLTHLTFANGVQAHIFVSWLHPYKDHRMVVIGESGMIVFDDVLSGPEKVQIYHHELGWDGDVPVVSKADSEPIAYGNEEPLKLECQTFIDAICTGSVPPSNSEEGVRVLKVLNACQTAMQDGGAVRP
jgi:UDP-2-acetamido-3-amino-2,3-dideoxy-glucuronate N-acetyltransferase